MNECARRKCSHYIRVVPIKARARGKRAIERDQSILDSSLVEAVLGGVDHLGMVAVARRSGLTAGSVYARHENVAELVVAVWLERCAGPTLALIADLVDQSLGHDVDFDPVSVVVGRAAPHVIGIELMALARRHPELAEEVVPAVDAILRWNDRDQLERARIATLLGLTLGGLIHGGSSTPDVARWTPVFAQVRGAVTADPPTSLSEWNPQPGRAVRAVTGEPLRDALLNAACAVIGKSGLAAATNSRIARRAGLTPGAVYTRYEAKDDLVIDALRVLLDEAITDNDPVTTGLDSAERMGLATAQLLSRAGGDERRSWLDFRLEVYLAATHRRDLAALLDEFHANGRARYGRLLAPGGVRREVAGWVALVGQSIPLGLAILDHYAPGIESIDFRPVALPLFDSVMRA